MRRLGSAHDGGYVVAIETIRRARHLLSFGVATNWDFERDALAANPALTVDAYDPSVRPRRFAAMAVRSGISAPLRLAVGNVRGAAASFRKARTAVDYFRFFAGPVTHTPKRVWYNTDRDSAAIGDIIAGVRRRRQTPVFAKIDIEGSEYRILPWIIGAAELFTGLVVEFHDTDICAHIFNAQLERLLEHFMIAHVHGNNFGDLAVDASLPLTLEITFVHRAIATRLAQADRAHLDAPNDPRRPDYVIDLAEPRVAYRSLAVRRSHR